MATDTVPGADPKNNDKLARGCWAEHEDGSLIFVKDIDENDRVIFEMYDFKNPDSPVYYSHALTLKDFEDTFSYKPEPQPAPAKKPGRKKNSAASAAVPNIKWTWHDKTPMPWDKVMKLIDRPLPTPANMVDTLTSAARMAESLGYRMTGALTREHIEEQQGLKAGPAGRPATTIMSRLRNAFGKLRAA